MRKPVEFVGWPDHLAVPYGPYRAVVRHHVDGDTFDCLVDFGFNLYSYAPIRLRGVDTPETNRARTRTAGLAALAYLREILPVGSRVQLYTEPDPDSFGRYLAFTLREDGQDVSTMLVEAGHGVRPSP